LADLAKQKPQNT